MRRNASKMVVALTTCLVIGACTSREQGARSSVQDLPEWTNKPIQEMIGALGSPDEQHEYTVGKAPTKNWNHGIIFSVYPKENPANREVVIKEYAWTQGDYKIRACCHLVNAAWLVMGAIRIHKDVRF